MAADLGFLVLWGVITVGGGAAVAANVRGAAETFHGLIPEHRRWPRTVRGLRVAAGAWAALGAAVVGVALIG
ncbi:hypothetical protein TNCT1_17890 [Streptomyces sp. 1-11]|uniref:hypothetical protein n=1 Tax=Streptomyces sp. NPDC001037 TaxID=3364542 RepID=UPI00116E9C8E|nr:hypothetical protein TNCT1_17890 [Streptomyces sp. 1-11]